MFAASHLVFQQGDDHSNRNQILGDVPDLCFEPKRGSQTLEGEGS